MKIKKIKFIFLLFISVFLFGSNNLNAANNLRNKLDNLDGNNTSIKTIVDNGGMNTGTSAPVLVSSIIKLILGLFGTVALIFVIKAGISWMKSKGNPEEIKKARSIIASGFIGLAIIAVSYSLTDFFLNQIYITINNGEIIEKDDEEEEGGSCSPVCKKPKFNDVQLVGTSDSVLCSNGSIASSITFEAVSSICSNSGGIKKWSCHCEESGEKKSCYVCK